MRFTRAGAGHDQHSSQLPNNAWEKIPYRSAGWAASRSIACARRVVSSAVRSYAVGHSLHDAAAKPGADHSWATSR